MDDICGRYGLHTIELADKSLFDQAFATLRQPISDYTFANTFIWRTGLHLYWRLIHGHVCVFAHGSGDLTMLIPPVGEGDLAKALSECFAIMDDYNQRIADRSHSRIEYVSEEMLARLVPHGLAATPMGCDYVYDTQRMIDLAGGELKSKRQAKSKFAREHHVEVTAITPADVPACLRLLSHWQAYADAHAHESDPAAHAARVLRERDTLATREALASMEALGLAGMILWADGSPIGFTMGEPLGSHQASIVVEKTDLTCYGAAQYIFSEFCRVYWSSYPEINVGDDWGLPGLRRTKESYRPKAHLAKYVVTAPERIMSGWRSAQGDLVALAADVGQALVPAEERTGEAPGAPAHEPCVAIEPAVTGDLDALCRLEKDAFGELAIARRQVTRLLKSTRARSWIARAGGETVGWIVVLLRRHKRYESGRVYTLAVAPGWRGKGVGTALIRRALEELERLGIARCFLEVAADNDAARRLYQRFGFVTLATLPDYYAHGRHAERMLRVGSRETALPGS